MIRLLRPQWQQLFCCSGGCVCNAAHGGSDGLAPVQQQKLLLTPKDSRPSAITRHAATASDAGSMPSRSFAFLSLRRHQELENVKQGSSCRASADRAASAACPAPIPVPSKTETTGQGILSMPRQCLDKVLLHLLWQTCAQTRTDATMLLITSSPPAPAAGRTVQRRPPPGGFEQSSELKVTARSRRQDCSCGVRDCSLLSGAQSAPFSRFRSQTTPWKRVLFVL